MKRTTLTGAKEPADITRSFFTTLLGERDLSVLRWHNHQGALPYVFSRTKASMEIRLLTSDDQLALERFLLPRVSSGMFLLGNSRTAGIGLSDEQYSGVYAAEIRGDDIRGVLRSLKGEGLRFSQVPMSMSQ